MFFFSAFDIRPFLRGDSANIRAYRFITKPLIQRFRFFISVYFGNGIFFRPCRWSPALESDARSIDYSLAFALILNSPLVQLARVMLGTVFAGIVGLAAAAAANCILSAAFAFSFPFRSLGAPHHPRIWLKRKRKDKKLWKMITKTGKWNGKAEWLYVISDVDWFFMQ